MESRDEELQPIQPGSSTANGTSKSYSNPAGNQFGYKSLEDPSEEPNGKWNFYIC